MGLFLDHLILWLEMYILTECTTSCTVPAQAPEHLIVTQTSSSSHGF